MTDYNQNVKVIVSAVDETKAAFASVGSQLGSLGSDLKSIGGTLTKFVSLPLAGIGALAVKNFGDFSFEIQRAGAYVNATAQQLKDFEKAAVNAAKGTQFSAVEAAKALGSFVGGEISAQQATEELADVLKFAMIAGLDDLQEAVDISSTALVRFQDEGLTMKDVMDTMAAVASNVTIRTDLFAKVLGNVSAATKSAGYSFKETNILISELVKGGARLETIESAINSGFVNMRDVSKGGKEALEEVGLSATGLADALEQGPIEMLKYLKTGYEEANKTGKGFNFLVDVIGREAAPEFSGALMLLNDQLDETAGYLENVSGKGDKMAKTLADALPPLIRLKKSFEELSLQIGQSLQPLMDSLSSKMEALAKWFSGLDDNTKNIIVDVGIFLAALGPVLFILGQLAISITALMPVFASLGVLLANPVTLAVLGILVVIGEFIVIGWILYNDWALIKEGIGLYLKEMWDYFYNATEGIRNILQSIMDFFIFWGTVIKDAVITVFTSIGEFLLGIIYIWATILEPVWLPLINATNALLAWIKPILSTLKDFIIGIWTSIKETIVAIWSSTVALIKEKIDDLKSGFAVIGDVLNIFKEIWGKVWDWVTGKIQSAWSLISGPINSIANGLQHIIDLASKVVGTVGGAIGTIGDIGKQGIQSVGSALGFQSGGIVPGPLGSPVPAIVHGGEQIIPVGRRGVGGITVNILGGTYLSEEVAEEIGTMIIDKLRRTIRI